MDLFDLSYGVLWTIVVVQLVVLFALLRLVGMISAQVRPTRTLSIPEAPQPGRELGSHLRAALQSQPGRDALVLFVAEGCDACTPLLPSFKYLVREYGGSSSFIVVDTQNALPSDLVRSALPPEVLVLGSAVADDLDVQATPVVVTTKGDGVVHESGVANSLGQLESYLARLHAPPSDGGEVAAIPPTGRKVPIAN